MATIKSNSIIPKILYVVVFDTWFYVRNNKRSMGFSIVI